jgi:hypothetical protein
MGTSDALADRQAVSIEERCRRPFVVQARMGAFGWASIEQESARLSRAPKLTPACGRIRFL